MRKVIALLMCVLLLLPALSVCVCGTDGPTDGAYSYPDTTVIQLDLFIQPYAYLKVFVQADDQERSAAVSVNEGEIHSATIRLRGSSSYDNGLETASGRMPFKLQLESSDSLEGFEGNTTLKLINCMTSAQLMMQWIGMQTYDYLGIPVPRMKPVFIRINGVDFGTYLIAEDLNEDFLRMHYDRVGSLFRQRDEKKSEEDGDGIFCLGLGLMDAKIDHGDTTLRGLEKALNTDGRIEQYLNVDEALRFMACEAFTYNLDGLVFGNANFYAYDNDGRIEFLPWDVDYSFFYFANGRTQGSVYDFENFSHPILTKLLENPTYKERYYAYIRQLNEEFLDPDTFFPWLERAVRALSPYLQRDQTIRMYTQDMYAELMTGRCLYNGTYGNIADTLKYLQFSVSQQLQDSRAAFTVPAGYTTTDQNKDALYVSSAGRNGTIPAEICRSYWKLRRSVYRQAYARELWWIGGLFAAAFGVSVVCVLRPKGQRSRGKRVRKKVE